MFEYVLECGVKCRLASHQLQQYLIRRLLLNALYPALSKDETSNARDSKGHPSLRKVAGQDSLKAPTRQLSTKHNKEDISVLERQPTYFEPESVPGGPNSRKQYDKSSFRMRALAEVASATPGEDTVQVISDPKHQPHHLAGSFCIVDLQLPGYPVGVVSSDLVPEEELQGDEALFLEEQYLGKSGQICINESSFGVTYHLIIKGDLVECSTQLATHRFIAQVNITELALRTPLKQVEATAENVKTDEEDDVWMIIAREEMEANRSSRTPISAKLDQTSPPNTVRSSLPADLESSTDVALVRQSYECCFVISPLASTAQDYDITHVSRSIVSRLPQHKTLRARYPRSADCIIALLAKGEQCTANLNDRISGKNGSLCCNPMFGPDLNCWLCFFFP
ncbi:MAG: hypothetical protein Q9187_006050 [Circinaria calcarea]